VRSTTKTFTLASFWHDLPREGKFLLSTVIFEFIGTGLVLPFSVVYLHEVRHFEMETVGLLLGLPAVVGLLMVTPAGAVTDRVGARLVLLSSITTMILSNVVLAFATTPLMAAAGLALMGYGHGVSWPAINSLIGNLVPSEIRQRYFGINFTLLNLGIGIGGLVGGRFVDVARPETFTAIYLVDAASYLFPLVILLWPLRHAHGRAAAPEAHDPAARATTYLTLLRDRSLTPLLALSLVAAFVGYAQINSGLPAFARTFGEVSTEGLGYAFAVNTFVIVVLQIAVLQRIEGRRRTRVALVMAAIWALSWLLLGATSVVPGTIAATVLLSACMGVFGLGETMLQPTVAAMTNDLAPDHLRGRYNALSSLMFQLASVVGPVSSGLLIGARLGNLYVGVLVGGCALLAVMALLTERRLPRHANGIREPSPPRAGSGPAAGSELDPSLAPVSG
jgi:MFS family permease